MNQVGYGICQFLGDLGIAGLFRRGLAISMDGPNPTNQDKTQTQQVNACIPGQNRAHLFFVPTFT
jgi:hypothetical protein